VAALVAERDRERREENEKTLSGRSVCVVRARVCVRCKATKARTKDKHPSRPTTATRLQNSKTIIIIIIIIIKVFFFQFSNVVTTNNPF